MTGRPRRCSLARSGCASPGLRSPYGLLADGDLMAVLGRDPTSASPVLPVAKSQFFLWTTIGGDRWEAHVFDNTGGVVGEPAVLAVGPVLVASTSTSVGFDVFTSNNQGTSWRRVEIRGLDQAPFEGLTTVGVPEMQDGRVTTDGGATWHEIVIDPPPPGDEGPYLSTPLEVPGGWLASASSSEVGDVNYGMLLRSNDGRSWRQILPDPAPPAGPTRT